MSEELIEDVEVADVDPGNDPVVPEKEWSGEDEERARFLGWKPAEEWQGERPPQGLIEDPRDYVTRAESILPFRKLQERYDRLEQSVEKIDRAYAAQVQRTRQNYEAQIARLRAQQVEAAETGDVDTVKAAQQEEDRLRKALEPQRQPEQRPAELDPETRVALDSWVVDNDWFGQDADRTQAAQMAWDEAVKRGIQTPAAILKYVDKTVAAKFPARHPQRQTAMVDGGLSLGGGAEQFSRLPGEAKDAFRRMVKQGLFEDTKEDRAQYYKDYSNE